MSTEQEKTVSTHTTEQSASLLDQITSAMPRAVERNEAQDMVKNLITAAMEGTLV